MIIAGFKIEKTVAMPFTAKFTDFLGTVPTTFAQKWSVFWFDLTNPKYGKDRLLNWIGKNRFEWESTLWATTKI